MSQPQQILDYASPGRGGRFRVGARSVIRAVESPGGSVKIDETLENRGVAATLILLDLLLITLMVSGLRWHRILQRHAVEGDFYFILMVAIAMLTGIVYVIKHNWARTTIDVNVNDGFTLRFRDPFTRKRYHMERYAVMQIAITQSGVGGSNELLLLGNALEMRLFTAHPWAELERIRKMLAAAIAGPAIPVAELAAEAPPYAQIAE